MADNVFRILTNLFRCLLTIKAQEPHNVTSVVVTLHSIIWTLYRADHQGLADEEDNHHMEIPGA